MSENNKIKQLENKVELLSRIVLENDFCQKELCVMALKNGWSADIPDKITALMQKFSEKQTFKCREFETAFDEIGDNLSNSIGSVIDCFYRCNVFIRVLFIYLESYFLHCSHSSSVQVCISSSSYPQTNIDVRFFHFHNVEMKICTD